MFDIRLRPTTPADLDYVLAAEHADENHAFVSQWNRERHEVALLDADTHHLIIERIATHDSVGYIILSGFTNTNQSIEFRRIVITAKGNGYGRQALQLVKQFAFEQFSAHRLWLDVLATNMRARHIYEAEGFVVEGTLRECFKIGERFESLVVMSVLQYEYAAQKQKL